MHIECVSHGLTATAPHAGSEFDLHLSRIDTTRIFIPF